MWGENLFDLSGETLSDYRNRTIGFVFQSFHLIPTLTARENIQVPLELRGEDAQARERAAELLTRVGLGDRGHHYPAQLSGGEQQRVAVARAFAHRPRILFADEPTGNLDAANGANVIALLGEMNRELETTLVLVTHDPELAGRAHRVLRLRDGAVVSDSPTPETAAARLTTRLALGDGRILDLARRIKAITGECSREPLTETCRILCACLEENRLLFGQIIEERAGVTAPR